MIHFELIFFIRCEVQVKFYFLFLRSFFVLFCFVLPMDSQLLQHHLLKRLSFLYWIALDLYQKLLDCTCVGLFLGSLYCSTVVYVDPSAEITQP